MNIIVCSAEMYFLPYPPPIVVVHFCFYQKSRIVRLWKHNSKHLCKRVTSHTKTRHSTVSNHFIYHTWNYFGIRNLQLTFWCYRKVDFMTLISILQTLICLWILHKKAFNLCRFITFNAENNNTPICLIFLFICKIKKVPRMFRINRFSSIRELSLTRKLPSLSCFAKFAFTGTTSVCRFITTIQKHMGRSICIVCILVLYNFVILWA